MTDLQSDPPGEDRRAFLQGAPRRVVEIKAALGALIADPSSVRMREEFRRRLEKSVARARLHELGSFADGLQLCLDQLDAVRALATLSRPHLDRFAALVASLNGRLDLDQRAPAHGPASEPPNVERGVPTESESVFPGIDALTRRVGQHGQALDARPTPGSVPLPGAAAQVVLALAPSRVHALLELLPNDVEVHVVVDRLEAAQRARDTHADLVVLESSAPFDGAAAFTLLRGERSTDAIPVAIVAAPEEPVDDLRRRCRGAFEVLADDVEPEALRDVILRALRGGPTLPPPPMSDLREATVDELARALQDEIRRGLVDSVEPAGRDARVSLGEGSEVLAAAWRAIATIRDLVEQRSHGAVRFEVPVSPRGFPGAEVLSVGLEPTDDAAWTQPGEDPLPGRRALVVDDDPKVTAHFAETLRRVGMSVFTRNDGRAGLEAARALGPDVILTDILMPGMDGFALCRAVRRDALLRHTPVILLSWREDLLVRMRELGAQAQGYLRKEARIDAVIARVRAALRLRTRTLRRIAELPWGAQVRGRVERVGLPPILDAAAALKDATVTIGDSVSVTEVELRGGRIVGATRTLQNGSVVRGEEALTRVVATPAARFGVRRSSASVRHDLDGEVPELLRACARRVAALEDALVGAGLLRVHSAVFDADVATAYSAALPHPMRTLVERMLAGDAPRDLVLRDGVAPADLEPLLIELARRGAVREVRDRDGRDLGALRLSSPDSTPPMPELDDDATPMPLQPPRSSPRPPPADDGEGTELDLGESLADAVFRQLTQTVSARELAQPLTPSSQSPLRAATPSFGTPDSVMAHDRSVIEPMRIVPLAERLFDSEPPPPPAPATPPRASKFPSSAPSASPVALDAPKPRVSEALAELVPVEPEPMEPVAEQSPEAPASLPAPPVSASSPQGESLADAPPPSTPPADLPEQPAPPAIKAGSSATASEPPGRAYARPLQAPPADADADEGVGRTLRLVVVVLAAALASYVAVRVLFARSSPVVPETPLLPAPPPQGLVLDAGAETEAAPRIRVPDAGPDYVEPAQFLDASTLGEGLGLLVVPRPRLGSPRVDVIVEHVGRYTAPAVIPLPEQVYRLRFETGRIRSTQFATIRQGWALLRPSPSEQ